MDALMEYSIPIRGIKLGLHSFDFQINSDFFSHFPDSLIKAGNFEVRLDFDKRIDLYELNFFFNGTIETSCDRCLAAINLPVEGKNRLVVKFSEDFLEDLDVIYIPFKTERLNVAKYIYEYLSLAVPYIKTYNCQSEELKPCDTQMLTHLQKSAGDKNSELAVNPVWDQLKNIKFN